MGEYYHEFVDRSLDDLWQIKLAASSSIVVRPSGAMEDAWDSMTKNALKALRKTLDQFEIWPRSGKKRIARVKPLERRTADRPHRRCGNKLSAAHRTEKQWGLPSRFQLLATL